MNGLVKKVVAISLIGCLQLGTGAAVVEAATRHDGDRQRQEQRDDRKYQEQRERERRHQEEQRRLQEQRERERRHQEEKRLQEQRERERRHREEMERHEREMRRRDHESEHEWHERQRRENERHDNTLRDIGLGLILLTILANSGGGDDSGN